jgi:hypothetical protein
MRGLGLMLGVLVAAVASATTVIAPHFEALVDQSDLIFTGRMLSQRSEWREINGQRSIVTLVTFGVQKIHKGQAASTITLQFLGGTIGDVSLEVAEMPTFKPGERVVLFAADNGASACPLVGFFHGKFSLVANAQGRDEVRQHDGEPVGEVNEIGRRKVKSALAGKRALSHDEFSAAIRERVARAGKR